MTQRDDLDQLLSAWVDDPYTPPAPRYLGNVLERTRTTRQRPAWASLERWLPMADKILQPTTAPPLRMAWLLLIALLVVALVGGLVVVGSRLFTSTDAIPKGGAAVLVFDSENAGLQDGDIYTVRADGTDLRQLTSGPDVESGPVFSPDGTRIAYRLSQGGTDFLVVMDAAGGNRTTLATIGESPVASCVGGNAAWSPDGKSIVYPTSVACDGRYDLFIVAADGTSPSTRLLASELNGSSATWAPDGTRIAFVGREATGNPGLYVVDVGTDSARTGGLQARRITEAGANLTWMDPQWSPDGTEVAAAAGTNVDCISYSSGTMDVFVVNADGSGQRTLAAETAKEYNPTWSPDGKHLAFQRIVDASEWVLGRPCTMATWVADADGTNQHRVDGLGADDFQPPFWSPDGTRLVGDMVEVIDSEERYHLYVVAADSSSPLVPIYDAGFATWQPVAAPLPPAPSFSATP